MRFVVASCVVALTLGAFGCEQEGPAEKAGRQIDEAVESLKDPGEGPLEELGRELDEAVEGTKDAAREIDEAARKAAE